MRQTEKVFEEMAFACEGNLRMNALYCIPQNTGEVQFTHHSMYYALIVLSLCSIALDHANSFVPVLHSHFFLILPVLPRLCGHGHDEPQGKENHRPG